MKIECPNTSWNDERSDVSIIVLTALVRKFARDFRGVSHKLERVGQVVSIVSHNSVLSSNVEP